MAVRAWFTHTLPWVIVLFLVALFQVMRGAWIDAAIFAAALALALVPVSGVWGRRLRTAPDWLRPRLAVLIPLAAVLGTALFFAPRHGLLSGLVLAIVGLTTVTLAWQRRPAASVPPRPAVAAAVKAWMAVIIVVGLWEASSYLLVRWTAVSGEAMPAISELADPLLNTAAGKGIFLLLWLSAGVALVRRGWRAP